VGYTSRGDACEWKAMDRYLELTGQPLQTNETDRTVRSVEE
jgi:hypothetical protein